MPKTRGEPELLKYISDLLESLRRLAPRALRFSGDDAVHHARVTTRRLKAAIDLFEPVLSDEAGDEFAKVIRRLRRALGPVRDVDVMLDHLQTYSKHVRYAAASNWLIRRLRQRRRELHSRAGRKAPLQRVLKGLGGWWAIEEELAEAEHAAESLLRRAIRRELESFARRAERISHVGGNAEEEVREDVHALRIDGKRLRYTLELSIPLGFPCSQALLRSFKRLQDALGSWHDFVVISQECVRSSLDDHLALHDPHLYGRMLALAERTRRDSHSHLARFTRLWTRHGPAMKEEIVKGLQSRITCGIRSDDANMHADEHEPSQPSPSTTLVSQ